MIEVTAPMIQHPHAFEHDHDVCIERALELAEQLCEKKNLRLTPLRRQILRLVWQTHKPIGAYAIMELFQANSSRQRVAPPTVYRTLDFLVEHKLVHKIHSLNAFIGCTHPQHSSGDALFICTSCGYTEEVASHSVQQAIDISAHHQTFTIEHQILEITGRCSRCQQPNEQKGSPRE